jgi:hypothetical protein
MANKPLTVNGKRLKYEPVVVWRKPEPEARRSCPRR